MGAHDLELCVEIKRKVQKTCPSSGRVSRGHGFQGIVNLLWVALADAAVVHKLGKACPRGR